MKGVFTIATERRFADELARVVLAKYGGDPLYLADVLILLPTRRSAAGRLSGMACGVPTNFSILSAIPGSSDKL